MSRWSLAGRLAGSLALGAALGPYDYPDAITSQDTRIALAVVVAPLFLALWLDRETRRKLLATLLVLGGIVLAALAIFLFFALGDRSPRLWFLIAAWLIPGTAAFTFGRIAPRINASMKMGIGCGLLAGIGVLAHTLILQVLEPVTKGPCDPPIEPGTRCFTAHGSLLSGLAGLALMIYLFFLVLGVVMAIFEGIIAVACRIWITRLANGLTPLGQPRGVTR